MNTTIFVPGTPAPQGSKRAYVRGGRAVLVESSDKVKPWRADVRDTIAPYVDEPISGPVALEIAFTMPRPKSTPKRRTPPAVKKPDLDKLVRACMDALTSAGLYLDDSQVVDLRATKRLAEIGEVPGACITWIDGTEAGEQQ